MISNDVTRASVSSSMRRALLLGFGVLAACDAAGSACGSASEERALLPAVEAPAVAEPDDPVQAVEAVEPEADAGPSSVAATEDWLPPVVGRITSTFGMREDDTMHDAVDIAAPVGTDVAAPLDLRISYIGYRTKAGRFIIADTLDGRFELTFAHLSHVDVVEGQRVARGELLALTGVSGAVTGPHLHFRVEKVAGGERVAIDPLTVIAAQKITGE